MDDILLTKEELEKQREAFDYEMTQVILNLKGTYAKFDRENSPIKDSQEFADEVLGRRLDFEPLSLVLITLLAAASKLFAELQAT
jgi:hypothetical protein